jgi:hypothetical protein
MKVICENHQICDDNDCDHKVLHDEFLKCHYVCDRYSNCACLSLKDIRAKKLKKINKNLVI